MDGYWLALGEYSGRISLWDLRSGRRQWIVEGAERMANDPADPYMCCVDHLHIDAVAGLLSCVNSILGHARVYRVARMPSGRCHWGAGGRCGGMHTQRETET